MKIEQIIEKDKQKQTNPFAFTRLQSKLKEKTNSSNSFALLHSLQIISLVLVFSFNLFLQTKNQEATLQETSFEQFAEENYFDILTNYYPTILFE